ncbi:hypothetical protein JXB02_01295 [Candidatus Woesearchaeota archaeon]|nr:hypothetical protein [Candidatus Woesearchaeota archaeon]
MNDLTLRYSTLRRESQKNASSQAMERGVHISDEPYAIVKKMDIPGNVAGEEFWGIASYILAEYPTDLGFQVASAFHRLSPGLGYDPFGKIMVGMQFVDRKAGSSCLVRVSFAKDHPALFSYLTERDCPERTEKSIDFLANATFQFPSVEHARQIFPKMFVVPEVKASVTDRLIEIDPVVGKYLVG